MKYVNIPIENRIYFSSLFASNTENETEALLDQFLLWVVATVILGMVVETKLPTVVTPAHQACRRNSLWFLSGTKAKCGKKEITPPENRLEALVEK